MPVKHGVYIYENDTPVRTPIEADSAIVVIGSAPVHYKADYSGLINKPILCNSAEEAIETFGYDTDFAKYTLCQMMYLTKTAFPVSPVVYINVYDPKAGIGTSATASVEMAGKTTNQVKNLGKDVLWSASEPAASKIVVNQGEGVLQRDRDYTVEFTEDHDTIVTILVGGTSTVEHGANADDITINYNNAHLMSNSMTDANIVGAYDPTTGVATGTELIQQIYHKFGVIPSIIICPTYSKKPAVGAALIAKAANINGVFKGMALVDLDADASSGAKVYTDTLEKKTSSGFTSPYCIPLWPCFKMGNGAVFAASSVIACLMAYTDAENRGIPSRSFSNKLINQTGAGVIGTCLENGTEVLLTQDQANHVNAGGVTTAINMNGWRTWGSYTGAFPAANGANDETILRDTWAPVRRMFNWQANTFILTYFSKVDDPLNYVLIESVVDSENIRCAAYAPDSWAGAEIEFLEADNPAANLLAGHITFRQRIAPYTPAQEIDNILSYDTSMLTDALFGAE